MSSQARFERATGEYKGLEEDLSTAVEARRRLEEQLTENRAVEKEMLSLKTDDGVFKLIGTVLVPQEAEEAKLVVKKRLDYITEEIQRAETRLKDLRERIERKKIEVVKLQGQLQEG